LGRAPALPRVPTSSRNNVHSKPPIAFNFF
jgi:hypothetical protein